MIVLWTSCTLASQVALGPLWVMGPLLSLPGPPPSQCRQISEEGKGGLGDPGETRFLLSKLWPCPLVSQSPQKYCLLSAMAWATLHRVKVTP